MRPCVYRNIAKQLNINVAVEAVVSDAFLSVATEIMSMGKWAESVEQVLLMQYCKRNFIIGLFNDVPAFGMTRLFWDNHGQKYRRAS